MMRLRLMVEGVHSDAPELSGDLAILCRIVADEFEVALDDEPLYREVAFPVLELAQALDSWLRRDMPSCREFVFEPTGAAEPGALQFRPADGKWIVDSSQRPSPRAPQPIAIGDLEASVRRYLHDISLACTDLDVDLDGLLERMRRYSEDHEERERRS